MVDGFALSSFDVVGTLLGTVEAAWLAARYRDRVGRLVLRAPVMGLADWAQIPVVRAVLAALEHDWEFFIEAFSQLVVGWGNPNGRALASLFRQGTTRDELRALLYAYTRLDLMPLFTAIQAPTLVEHNPAHFFPPTYSRSIASVIPNCRMVIYSRPQGPVRHRFFDGAGVLLSRAMTCARVRVARPMWGWCQRPGGASRLSSSAKCCTSTTSVGGGSATASSRSMK